MYDIDCKLPILVSLESTLIFDAPTANFSTSEGLAREARDSLITILASPNQAYFPETLEVLRISTKNGALRRRFVAYKEVVEALFHALERMTKRQREGLFPLVMDILCYLIDDSAYN